MGRAHTLDALRLYETHGRIHGYDTAKTALLGSGSPTALRAAQRSFGGYAGRRAWRERSGVGPATRAR